MFWSFKLLPWKQSLNQDFKNYLVFFAYLETLKVNTIKLKAIKVNRILVMYTKLQSAAHNHTFCMISFSNIVTIATQSSVFMKNRVNWLLGNQNKGHAYLVILL